MDESTYIVRGKGSTVHTVHTCTWDVCTCLLTVQAFLLWKVFMGGLKMNLVLDRRERLF